MKDLMGSVSRRDLWWLVPLMLLVFVAMNLVVTWAEPLDRMRPSVGAVRITDALAERLTALEAARADLEARTAALEARLSPGAVLGGDR